MISSRLFLHNGFPGPHLFIPSTSSATSAQSTLLPTSLHRLPRFPTGGASPSSSSRKIVVGLYSPHCRYCDARQDSRRRRRFANELRSSLKDRAEHVMLVDLARNGHQTACAIPCRPRLDRLMVVEKFSHVQHLVSQVSGVLRPEQDPV